MYTYNQNIDKKSINWSILFTYIGTGVLLITLALLKADYYSTLVKWKYTAILAHAIAFAFETLRFTILYTSVSDFQKGKVHSALAGVLFGVLFSIYDTVEAYHIGIAVHSDKIAVPLVFLSLSVLLAEMRILLHVDNGEFVQWITRKKSKSTVVEPKEEEKAKVYSIERTAVPSEANSPFIKERLSERIRNLRAEGKTVKAIMEELNIGSKATYYKYAAE